MTIIQPLTPRQKALEVNIDSSIYGSFAEIGAGQEVARNFFRAGGAAGTIAQSISAYDMAMSDSIYSRSEDGRYVSIHRLRKMLSHEFTTVLERLKEKRSPSTRFFTFADTVSAKGFKGNKPCHGWLGVRFQHQPGMKHSDVIIHVKMYDTQAVAQYETIGILGVNLIHSCFHHADDYQTLVSTLMDNLSKDSIEIDMIIAHGPAFEKIDSRILNLELVTQGHTKIAIFDEQGRVQPTADILYKKNLLVLRGSFRPPTNLNLDMLNCGLTEFAKELGVDQQDSSILVLPEISMNNLRDSSPDGTIKNEDFLARIDLLNALGRKVMISNYDDFYCLNSELSLLSRKKIAFVLGYYNLVELFDNDRFSKHNFGHLGALGSMFNPDTRVYVYPYKEPGQDHLLTSVTLDVAEQVMLLKDYLVQMGKIMDLPNYHEEFLSTWSKDVLQKIQTGVTGWEELVPATVVKTIRERSLFMPVNN